jgi:hypothetical protein
MQLEPLLSSGVAKIWHEAMFLVMRGDVS